ncbi:ATP-binding cassette domain-containing protein [Streptomyces sp. NPDC058200]|uniref:ATP-binding cassette domain-containing protein n=1 Tax=Streptomyces sp. NPDC058200 TaxID=3346378 RepID=UPI0036E3D00B
MNLRGVGRRYGLRGPWVLRGVDLDLPAGGLVRVEGTNGSGKSTLLRLLAGIDAPTEGRLTGRPRTAYVPERFPVSLPFTATGYLVHLGAVHGLRRAAARARAAEWLERFGAAGQARTPMSELSKGTSHPLRLAGVADAVYAVRDRALVRRTPDVSAAGPGPRVRIVAVGPPGAAPPSGLPGSPAYETERDGSVLLTAPAVHSDALLRALLTARPPWHIREVRAAEAAGVSPAVARTPPIATDSAGTDSATTARRPSS